MLRERFHAVSALSRAAGLPRPGVEILIAPITAALRYQGVAVMTFTRAPGFEQAIAEESMALSERALLGCLMNLAFQRLVALGAIATAREGELTAREREVMAMSALGATAEAIARRLAVSKRTVIAHLANAIQKLGAANKTEGVIQALRYRQIGPGAGHGFYQMSTEIFAETDYDYKKVFS